SRSAARWCSIPPGYACSGTTTTGQTASFDAGTTNRGTTTASPRVPRQRQPKWKLRETDRNSSSQRPKSLVGQHYARAPDEWDTGALHPRSLGDGAYLKSDDLRSCDQGRHRLRRGDPGTA